MNDERDYVTRCSPYGNGGGGSMPGALVDEVIEYVDRWEHRVSLQALEALRRIARMLQGLLD